MSESHDDKFLQSVVRYYTDTRGGMSRPDVLANLWIVVPNQRALIFLRRYFRSEFMRRADKSRPVIQPQLMSMGEFNSRIYPDAGAKASKVEMFCALYQAYSRVCVRKGQTPRSFDRFVFWGDMILGDFEDIDSSLANAEDLYANLKRYNEISANFLTEEQAEIISKVFGIDEIEDVPHYRKEDVGSFWDHVVTAAKDAGETIDDADYVDAEGETGKVGVPKGAVRFLRLWQLLYDIYVEFNAILDQRRLTYLGRTERRIYHGLKHGQPLLPVTENPAFNAVRLAFVGFGQASLAQQGIMKYFQERGRADFFWDTLDLRRMGPVGAGGDVERLAKAFPMPEDYVDVVVGNAPEINVVAVPSNFMMSKMAGRIIGRWNDSGDIAYRRVRGREGKPDELVIIPDSTAIILPDTTLLPAIVHGLPALHAPKDSLAELMKNPVNVTIGLPYRDTPFSAMMRAIVSMHLRRRIIFGRPAYFHEDILNLVALPDLRSLMPDECDAVRRFLSKTQMYNISEESLTGIPGTSNLAPLFRGPEDEKDIKAVRRYFFDILDTICSALLRRDSREGNAAETMSNDRRILEAYRDAADEVFSCLARYDIRDIGEANILGLLERLLSQCALHLSGTPLGGIQVMGMLETRALDFDNIIVTSVNERVIPRRRRMRSLIPQVLRSAFHLPTANALDDEYAYYFFRLLNRCNRIVLLYDARSEGLSSGAPSRYVLQLRDMAPDGAVRFHVHEQNAVGAKERHLSVTKDARIMALLNGLRDSRQGFNLSASALKTYLRCPLRFYLDNVRGLKEDDTPTDYMDYATYGTVIHNALQDIYMSLADGAAVSSEHPVRVEASSLRRIAADHDGLVALLQREIKKDVLQKTGRLHDIKALCDTDPTADRDSLIEKELSGIRLSGDRILLSEEMAEYVSAVLLKDADDIEGKGYGSSPRPFSFAGAEVSLNTLGAHSCGQWRASDKNTVNIRMDIDRMDVFDDGMLRFIDYKTGRDKPDVRDVDALFSENPKERNDAIFQLLFYAMVYSDLRDSGDGKTPPDIEPQLYRIAKAFSPDESYPFADSAIRFTGDDKGPVIWRGKGQPWQDRFRAHVAEKIDSIFDPETPFSQCSDVNNCRYCPYLRACARDVPDQ